MEITEDFKKYLAGLFDGDGSITVEKMLGGFSIRIKFSQSNQNLLQEIQRRYSFLKVRNDWRSINKRCEFELRGAGAQIEPLVDDLMKFSILKYEQLCEAKKFFPLIGKIGDLFRQRKQHIYERLKALKKSSSKKPYEKLCSQYIAGLFDAEGCITGDISVRIAQRSDNIVLKHIGEFYKTKYTLTSDNIIFYGLHCKKVLNDIYPYCIYKKPQIILALEYIKLIGTNKLDQKQKLLNQMKKEKHIDFDQSNITFLNQEEHKQYLQRCFENFKKLTTEDLMQHCKYHEILNMKIFEKFEKKIFTCDDWSNLCIEPELEFCETANQLSIYHYYRKKVSSLPYTGVIGRAIRILVRDSITSKYIGIMCLSSDVYNLGERDKYIGWGDKKEKLLSNLLNLSCCVPLQPFGFNTNGGKLIAKLAFSKEVFEYYLNKYKEPLLAIITTSINGKSVQYDRLKELKFIGFTKGYGSVYIPKELHEVCKNYNNIWKVIEKTNRIDKFSFIKNILNHLGINQSILKHGKQRGIYFGYVFKTKFNNNYDISSLNSVKKIYEDWQIRWCCRRVNILIDSNRLKKDVFLYTRSYFDNIKFNKYELPIKETKDDNKDNLIKLLLKYKTLPLSLEDISKDILEKNQIKVSLNYISRVFTGKLVPNVIDDEYTDLIKQQRPRTSKKRKLSDDVIYYVIDIYEKNQLSYTMLANNVNKKYKINVSKANISDILLRKIKPINPPKTIKENVSTDVLSKYTFDQIIFLIGLKSKNQTTQEASNEFKKLYGLYIRRDIISKLWKDELQLDEAIKVTDEYKNMVTNTRKRMVKNKKFTKDEIDFVINNTDSLGKCAQLFNEHFGKTITREYIKKLRDNNNNN